MFAECVNVKVLHGVAMGDLMLHVATCRKYHTNQEFAHNHQNEMTEDQPLHPHIHIAGCVKQSITGNRNGLTL